MLCVAGDSVVDERADSAVESRGVKRKISLTCCDVCDNEEAKYRCPNCLRFSCSLPCVKRHKLQSGCSGVRDKTAFVALSQFSEINLLNDYRYLEETARVADKPIRDTILQTPLHTTYSVKMLKKNAAAAKVNLRLLPRSFTRHKKNTSSYIKAEKKLYWHLKLHFPQSSVEYTDRVPEDRVLQQILSDYIHPTESDPVKRQRLKLYVLTPPDQMCVFLKSEQRRPGSPKYHELDLKKTLRENLMFRTILEYPELHMVLKEHHEEYLTKFPERRSAGQSSSPKETSDPAEYPKHVVKKRKSMTDESELEDGEIRSEEEEEDKDEQPEQPVCSADHAKVQNEHSMEIDHSLPLNDDAGGCDGHHNDQGGGADGRKSAMETNGPSSHDQGQEDVAVDAPDVKIVITETDHCLHDGREEDDDDEDCKDASVKDHFLSSSSQDKNMGDCGDEYDGGDGHQVGTAQDPPPSSHDQGEENGGGQVDCVSIHSAANGQKLMMEANDQLLHDHSEQGGDEDQIHRTANKETGGYSFSSVDKNIDDHHNHHNDFHQGSAANGQNISMQTNDPPPADQDDKSHQIHGGADSVSVHGGDNEDQVDKETDGHHSSSLDTNIKNVQNDDHNDDLHHGAVKTSASDKSITMESNDPPSSNYHGREDEYQTVDDTKYAASDNVHIFVMEAKSLPSSPQNTDQNPGRYDHQHGPADDQSISMEAVEAPPPRDDDDVKENKGQVDSGTDGCAAEGSAVGAIGEDSVRVEVEHSLLHCKSGDEDGHGQIAAAANDQDISVTEN